MNRLLKLVPIRTEYKINEKTKTVKCILHCSFLPVDGENTNDMNIVYSLYTLLNTNGCIVAGKAKCSKEDKFDEETGKKLALARAKAKAYKDMADFYVNAFDKLRAVADRSAGDVGYFVNLLRSQEDYIKDLENKL